MLTPQQCRLIANLMKGGRIKDACQRAGVSTRSYRSWKQEPEFIRALSDAQREAWQTALGQLKALAPAAVRRLRALLKSQEDSTALRTALGILDRATKATELSDLIQRLEALEQRRPAP
jgi:hypothetical protein